MTIHKSIQPGDVFFKSHYMVPSEHFRTIFESSVHSRDFLPKEIEQLMRMPFIEVIDYSCESRRARSSGSFFPSFDLPFIKAAGFTISDKQHAPFYRPETPNGYNFTHSVCTDYTTSRRSQTSDLLKSFRAMKKIPHGVGLAVNNENLFFRTLHTAKQIHADRLFKSLLEHCQKEKILAFMEEFSYLTSLNVFYNLFSSTYTALKVEDMHSYPSTLLSNSYNKIFDLTNKRRLSLIKKTLEDMNTSHPISLDQYRSLLDLGISYDTKHDLNNHYPDHVRQFTRENIEFDLAPSSKSYKKSNKWNADEVQMFFMLYFRYVHAKYIIENPAFKTFVSLYTEVVGQRLKEESLTNSKLYRVLGKRINNDMILRRDYFQNAMPQDYVHPMFLPKRIRESVMRWNDRYVRLSETPLILFAKSYFKQATPETPVSLIAKPKSYHSPELLAYPAFAYDDHRSFVNSAMRKRAFFLRSSVLDSQSQGLIDFSSMLSLPFLPTETCDAHVPFEIFQHHEPSHVFFSVPSALEANFELS